METQNSNTIKPNIVKVLLSSSIIIIEILIVGLIFFTVFKLMNISLIAPIAQSLEVLGISIEFDVLQLVGIAALGVLLYYGIVLQKTSYKYIFYQDQFLTPDKESIYYINVTSVNYQQKAFPDKLLGYGTLIIELTGSNKKEIQIEYIENVSKITDELNQMISNAKMQNYQETQNNRRVQNIIQQW